MFDTLKKMFTVKDIRKKILYTIFIILLFRIGTYITVPGINKIAFVEAVQAQSGGILGTINIISGGAFNRLSIFAMTISPYITASIVLNLLQTVVPSLERLAKEGETGKQKLAKYTKMLTIAFAVVEAIGLYLNYKAYLLPAMSYGIYQVFGMILFVVCLTAGTALLMWLSDKITENGIGNGTSMIIFVGIVSGAPGAITALSGFAAASKWNILIVIAVVIAFIILLAGVIFVQQAERRIPVNYAKRVVGRKMFGGQNTHIPLKVAMAGVMPIIFAMSFMMIPATIIQLVTKGAATGFWGVVLKVCSASTESIWYLVAYAVIYMLLIIAFTFVYTMFTVNPVEMSNQLKQNGGFIPGIRAGKNTAEYINKVLKNITWAGAVFLALVAVLPVVCQAAMPSLAISFGGTSILIVVSVALETLKVIESQMVSRHYDGFLN
ncbi:MAG: preprotein translocase subunit SecY [Clostridia bacterium]|nr:preprotein translocase subunit SecY [Clostridia bacterium]